MRRIEEDKRIGYEYTLIKVSIYPNGKSNAVASSEFDTKEEAGKWIVWNRKNWAWKRRYHVKIEKVTRISWNQKVQYATKQNLHYNPK